MKSSSRAHLLSMALVITLLTRVKVLGQDSELAKRASSLKDLQYVVGPKYNLLVATYWRHMLLPCRTLEAKLDEDLQSGLLKEFCSFLIQCPSQYPTQSCMVQNTARALRRACCQVVSTNESLRQPNSLNNVGSEPRAPPLVNEVPIKLDLKAQRACAYGKVSLSSRIYGGNSIEPGEFPWIIMLVRNDTFICGGSIVDATHIITAAHCFKGYNPAIHRFRVMAGKYSSNVQETEEHQQTRDVTSFVKHELYSVRLKWNDIAVVEVSSPFIWTDYVLPACLPGPNDVMAKVCTVAGWGRKEDGTYPPTMRKVSLYTYSRDKCLTTFKDTARGPLISYLHRGTVCAANGLNGGRDSCRTTLLTH
ncbi:ovochymase-2 [Aplysia californica]|uniref:Ovochymase-2 n=1 Tax=Aplysia californica TaxID=6500 RepID=A0ABM1A6W2_APLCA|nr:ovochymase-2 [Aplysia californica]